MQNIILLLGIFATIATLLPIIRSESAWIRVFDFPRIQIAVFTALVLLALLVFCDEGLYKYGLAMILSACVFYQIHMILPYTIIAGKQVIGAMSNDPSRKCSLLISNVLVSNRDVRKYLQIIKDADPDIILVAEPDNWWEGQLRSLEKSHNYTIKCPLDNAYGMLLYSRLKLINPEIKFLLEEGIPSMHALVELRCGDLVELHFLHPRPPHPTENPDTKERDVELLLIGREVKESSRPVIVAGDLNDVAWSRSTKLFQKISGLLDPRIGRGLFNTFHAEYSLFRFPLDHVFHSNHFRLLKLQRQSYFGSDHFPIYAQLSYEPETKIAQEAPSPDKEDIIESEKKIEQV